MSSNRQVNAAQKTQAAPCLLPELYKRNFQLSPRRTQRPASPAERVNQTHMQFVENNQSRYR